MAQVFMKHREDTCRKFYVKQWANRESLRISMKYYDKFNLNITDEVKVNKTNLCSILVIRNSWIFDNEMTCLVATVQM